MLAHTVYPKQVRFRGVLMDTWCATKDLMLSIDQLHKVFYCPLKIIDQVKHELHSEYLRQQLKAPAVRMVLS